MFVHTLNEKFTLNFPSNGRWGGVFYIEKEGKLS